MKIASRLLLIYFCFFALQFCSSGNQTGPAKVHWDREVCPRCRMAVSDKTFSTQIRANLPGKRSKVYYFDDFGCAILWLEEQAWKNEPNIEIWINHYQTGEWLAAKTSLFVKDQITPMDYRLGAINKEEASEHAAEATIDFEAAVQYVFELERERTDPSNTPGNGDPELQRKLETWNSDNYGE